VTYSGPPLHCVATKIGEGMDAQDYPIHHFREMSALAATLKTLPAQVLEHTYSYETFGSWSTLLRYNGVRIQLTFEGRDFKLSLRRSSSRNHPDQWGVTLRTKSQRDPAVPVSDIVDAIKAAATATQ
jgi:hypothetical protein